MGLKGRKIGLGIPWWFRTRLKDNTQTDKGLQGLNVNWSEGNRD